VRGQLEALRLDRVKRVGVQEIDRADAAIDDEVSGIEGHERAHRRSDRFENQACVLNRLKRLALRVALCPELVDSPVAERDDHPGGMQGLQAIARDETARGELLPELPQLRRFHANAVDAKG